MKTGLLCALAVLFTGSALAQQYPTKPIRIVVAFVPGGPADVFARIIGQKLTEAWGHNVVIDNRPGAGGNIGMEVAAKASRDGYTLALTGMHFVVNPSLYAAAGYDPIRDFAPVTLAAVSPVIIAAHPSFPPRDVRELVQFAKSNAVAYASPGTGTAGHLAGEMLAISTGARLEQIPYKGAAPAMNDLLGNHVKLSFTALPPAAPHVKTGKLRAIAVTTLARSASLPEVPTVAESGFPGFAVDNMSGIVATGGTPRAVVDKLNREIVRIVQIPEMTQRLSAQGFDPVANSPEEFGRYLRDEVSKWAKVVKQVGLRVD